jgi:hypothetical protein
MHLIYEALKKTGGKIDGDAMLAAMKGMAWESPRRPMSMDLETRDIVHDEYIRKVERATLQCGTVQGGSGEGSGAGGEQVVPPCDAAIRRFNLI